MLLVRNHRRWMRYVRGPYLRMNGLALLPLLFAPLAPAAASAQTQAPDYFMAGGQRRAVQVDWSLRAVRRAPTILPAALNKSTTAKHTLTAEANLISSDDRARFESLGFDILPADAREDAHAQGVPVWFTSLDTPPAGAPGVLTAWIVFKSKTTKVPRDLVAAAQELTEIPYSQGVWRARLRSPAEALRVANALHQHEDIVFSHPDFVLEIEARSPAPQEAPYFDLQWNLLNNGQSGGSPGADINILPAWARTYGAPAIIVADLDLGFEQTHPAMTGAWYVNSGEIPGNKIDDDQNGYKDDVSGWNFATNGNNLIFGASNKHGTATAGMIGARLGGRGTVGICPLCTILPLVVDNVPSNAAAAFYYAKAAGVSVISNSWGYTLNTPTTDVVVDAINDVAKNGRSGRGTSIVFAMSNFPRNDCRGASPDISSIPSVTATSGSDFNDLKTTTSAFGPCLKILAPTSDTTANAIVTPDRVGAAGYNDGATLTNIPDADYTNSFWGTSAAAPQVAGVMALLYALRPDATSTEVLNAVLAGADKVHPEVAAYDATGHSLKYGHGRLNAGRAAEALLTTRSR